ncbi:MAG: ABC transporter permease [Acidobacteriaceae bacterium]|nr:ABC transporter permease [Acidobacteriaceae bacterium]
MWVWNWIDRFWQDLRYGVRQLRLSPVFAVVAILSLALGIGANTAIFQLLDAVRLRSLPVPNPQQLAEVRVANLDGMGVNVGDNPRMTNPLWEEFRDHQQAFSGVFAWGTDTFRLGKGADARNVPGLWVSGSFFPVVGISPVRGRLLDIQDDRHGCGFSVVVISYGLWQSEFGGLNSVVGSNVMIQDHSFEVIGVTPPGFSGLDVGRTFDIALPICSLESVQSSNASFGRRDAWWLTVMGRLKPGWTLESASANLSAISPGLFAATVPSGYQASELQHYLKFRLAAYPAGKGVSPLRETFGTSLWLLLGITGFVLLIACANLANLMLARASARQREIAVRLALGASRRRLIQQLLSESLLLAVIGTLLGVYLARVLTHTIVWFVSTQGNTLQLDLSLDWRVLLFTASAAVLTCLTFGLMPALRSSRAHPGAVMKADARGVTAGRERFSFQRLLVVSQIAISLILVFSALLFVRSFRNLMTFNPGFRERGILLLRIDIRNFFVSGHISPSRLKPFQRELLNEIRTIPQVQSAAMSTHVPLDGSSWTLGFHLNDVHGSSKFTWTSTQYFETMGIPVLSGRAFNHRDTESSPRVALVNETFVHDYCGGTNPIGKVVRSIAEPNYPTADYEIVGVVRDAKYADLRDAIPPEVFGAAQQYPADGPWGPIFIRTSAPMSSVISAVKEKLGRAYPAMQMDFSIFQEQIRDRLVLERLMAALSGFFGALATILAIIGLYGVISYIVVRRRAEIGIRGALGATQGRILSMVMNEAAVLLLIGVAIGAAFSLAAGRAAMSVLFGLTSHDPLTLWTAVGLLAVIGAVASFVPARRASKVDPLVALRYE